MEAATGARFHGGLPALHRCGVVSARSEFIATPFPSTGRRRTVVAKVLEEEEKERSSLKDYFEQAKVLIKSDGGPPRWFSPLECGSRSSNSPLLLYLPGLDGVGLGLIRHHRSLGKIFDLWCLHIPVKDRMPFTELVKLIEGTARSEYKRLPDRPIYLVGDTLGGCLALAVAARNPDIDFVLILANPATSFSESQLQLFRPLLEAMPSEAFYSITYLSSFLRGDSTRVLIDILERGPIQPQVVDYLSRGLNAVSSHFSVINDILPRDTFIWKMDILKSASAYANSRLHAIKAQTLVLSSGRDPLLPSLEEGERLHFVLPKCEIRKFNDNGHFLFLEDGVDLVYTLKGATFYRHGRCHDFAIDYLPPTPSEFKRATQQHWWMDPAFSPVMLSTLKDGKIVRGLDGVPSEGPVLLVGYHMLMGFELVPLVCRIWKEKQIIVRGMAHPIMFVRGKEGRLPELSSFDTYRIMGAVPVSGANMFKLLSARSHVLLYPGGMREALHRKGEEYKLFWPKESEFVRMASRFGATIIPFGAVGEDDIGQLVVDYNDLMGIPYFRRQIEELTNEAVKLRTDSSGEVTNQDVHLPGILPKVPGRLYYLFGKPIPTEGRRQELKDKHKAQELYMHVKSEVERCLAYLQEKRQHDPYRSLLPRLMYQATHGFTSEVPTFEL